MFRLKKLLFGEPAVIDEVGINTTTTKVNQRLQSPLGDNDKITTPYQASSISYNNPLKTASDYLDGKQRTPDSGHGLLDDEDEDEVIDKDTRTDPGYIRKTWSIFFAIVCALIFAAVAGYALISFVFPPLWLLNTAALVGYLALDAVVAGIAAVIGYITFNQLYDAYSLNWKKATPMTVLAIVTAAVLFTVISVISGGLFPVLSSIVLGAGLLFSTLSTFLFGLSLWSIFKFGMSKVNGDAKDSIQSISFYPRDIVDFNSEGQKEFLPSDSIDADFAEGDAWRIISFILTIKMHFTSLDAIQNNQVNQYLLQIGACFMPQDCSKPQMMASFNQYKYKEFVQLFKDKKSSLQDEIVILQNKIDPLQDEIASLKQNENENETVRLLQERVECLQNAIKPLQAFAQFLQNKIDLLQTFKYETLFKQETRSFNESNYADFMDKCLNDMRIKGFTQHQQWFDETIALFDKQDFAKQYNTISAWYEEIIKLQPQPDDAINSTVNQEVYDNSEVSQANSSYNPN